MKKLFILISLVLITITLTKAQSVDSLKVNPLVIGIPSITLNEFNQLNYFINNSTAFKSAYFCSKHKVIIFNMALLLEKDELDMLFGSVIDRNKLFYKDISHFDEIINSCDNNSDNKKIK